MAGLTTLRRFVGLDLSLTSTGWAVLSEATSTPSYGRVRPGKLRGEERLVRIRTDVMAVAQASTLVAIEGYAFGARQGREVLGELGGVIRVALHEAGTPFIVVAPPTLKKLATGKGNAPKEAVLAAAIRKLGYPGSSNDEADALWLAHMARAVYMVQQGEDVLLTNPQMAAIRKVLNV